MKDFSDLYPSTGTELTLAIYVAIDDARACDGTCNALDHLLRARELVRALTPPIPSRYVQLGAHNFDLVRDLVRELDLAHACTLGLPLDLDLNAFSAYRDVIHHLESSTSAPTKQGSDAKGQTPSPRVSLLGIRLADIASRLLPPIERVRYAEEYQSELYELAAVSRRAQWAYGVRTLAHALWLRRELRRGTPKTARG